MKNVLFGIGFSIVFVYLTMVAQDVFVSFEDRQSGFYHPCLPGSIFMWSGLKKGMGKCGAIYFEQENPHPVPAMPALPPPIEERLRGGKKN